MEQRQTENFADLERFEDRNQGYMVWYLPWGECPNSDNWKLDQLWFDKREDCEEYGKTNYLTYIVVTAMSA